MKLNSVDLPMKNVYYRFLTFIERLVTFPCLYCIYLLITNVQFQTAFETFFNVFTLPLNVILQADLKTSIVIIERALDFIALFSISPRLEVQQPHESPESKFLQKLFSYLLKVNLIQVFQHILCIIVAGTVCRVRRSSIPILSVTK